MVSLFGLSRAQWLMLSGLLVLFLVPVMGVLLRLFELAMVDGLEFLPRNPRIESVPTPVVLHIVSSVIYCVLGAVQFLQQTRMGRSSWHRRAGHWLAASGALAALSGLWMTLFYTFPESLQGPLLCGVRILVSVAMMLCLLLGIVAVIKRRIAQHRAWMIRAYALGLGAGTQGFVMLPWVVTVGEPSGLLRDVLMTLA